MYDVTVFETQQAAVWFIRKELLCLMKFVQEVWGVLNIGQNWRQVRTQLILNDLCHYAVGGFYP